MSLKDILRSIARDYFIVATGVIAANLIGRLIFYPDGYITLTELSSMFLGSVVFMLPHFVFASKKELSKAQCKRRRILHLFILLSTVLCYGYLLGWLEGFNLLELLVIITSVLVIYLLVWNIGWQIDQSNSDLINRKLAELQEETNDD